MFPLTFQKLISRMKNWFVLILMSRVAIEFRLFYTTLSNSCSAQELTSVFGFADRSLTSLCSMTVSLQFLVYDRHIKTVTFTVFEECRKLIILGYAWLFLYNPLVGWKTPSSTFFRCLYNDLPSTPIIFGSIPISISWGILRQSWSRGYYS